MTTDSLVDELEVIRSGMDELLPTFFAGSFGALTLPTEGEARWSSLVREAKSLIDEGLGHANDFSLRLMSLSHGSHFEGGASVADIEEARELISAAVRQINRRASTSTRTGSIPSPTQDFISRDRIYQLRSIRRKALDFARLARLCEEVNIASAGQAYMAVALLVRAILDHVPPVFGQPNFAAVANNHSAADRSFRDAMTTLESLLRKVADRHLHSQMRAREDLPTAAQVNVGPAVDMLLGEIIRISPSDTG